MGKISKEEEILLNSYSSTATTRSTILFYINAVIVSLAPIYLFYGVYQMEVSDSFIVWTISFAASVYLLNMACNNQKRLLKDKIMMKRGTAVDREINQKYGSDKKMSLKEKEERALFRKNEVADNESTYFAIFITNIMFVAILLLLSFFLLTSFTPLFNNLLSMLGASGAISFLLSRKQN